MLRFRGMERWRSILLIGLVASVAAATSVSQMVKLDGKLNSSEGGFAWVTGFDEQDLEKNKAHVSVMEEDGQAAFPTLDSMLQWAIGHSDPEKLKNSAREAGKLSPGELAKRREEIQELMEKLKMPSDAELMKIAIADLNNSSLPLEDRKRALDELLELVEPIYNANDLHKLGGLEAVIRELETSEEELRTAAAWVVGKASQNNPLVQGQVLELGALSTLMKMVLSSSEEEAVKALYAVSAIIRNNPAGHEDFYRQGGAKLLQDLISTATNERITRKCLFLVADLAEQLSETDGKLESFVPQDELLKSVVGLLKASDLDTREKALMAVKSLSRVSSSTRKAFKSVCNLDSALENLRLALEDLVKQGDHAELARDMEKLRQDVLRFLQQQE